jgi:hypothetical protein
MAAPKRTFKPVDMARRGARKLGKLVGPEGRYVYRYRHPSGPPTDGYNLLRHCGASWAAAEIGRRHADLAPTLKAAERAMDWLLERHVVAFGDHLCVEEDGVTKLGGAGLAILALVEVDAGRGEARYVDAARGLAGFILDQRLASGDFKHMLGVADGAVRDFRSEYYTGEALFGLARLAEATGETAWLDAALASARKLAAEDYGVKQQSHWMLYALEKMYALSNEPWLHAHAAKIVEHIVTHDAYRARRKSTPIACRTEGLMAFLRMGPGPSIHNAVPLGGAALATVKDNLKLQARAFRPNGAFVEGDSSDWVQIDYIQHNISGFHAFHEQFQSAAA